MGGKVYLMQTVTTNLCKKTNDLNKIINFSLVFSPTALDVLPLSEENSNDCKLAEQLKILLEKNEDGTVGEISISGTAVWPDEIQRPSWQRKKTQKDKPVSMEIIVNEKLSRLLDGLYPQESPAVGPRYKIQIEGIFGSRENGQVGNLVNVDVKNCHPLLQYYSATITSSTANWNALFDEIPDQVGHYIFVTLVFCGPMNFSKRMAKPLTCKFPYGKGLVPILRKFVEKKRLKSESRRNSNAGAGSSNDNGRIVGNSKMFRGVVVKHGNTLTWMASSRILEWRWKCWRILNEIKWMRNL